MKKATETDVSFDIIFTETRNKLKCITFSIAHIPFDFFPLIFSLLFYSIFILISDKNTFQQHDPELNILLFSP